jgi:hypothetical protein
MVDDSDHKDNLLVRYLLNETSMTESEDLEDDMVLDEALADRLKTLEMLWIDRYLLKALSGTDEARFEQGFLLFPENRRKVEDAQIFHRAIKGFRDERESESAGSRPSTWLPPFLQWPSIRVPALAVIALLVMAAIAFVIYRFTQPKPDEIVNTPTNSKGIAATPNENRSPQNDSAPVRPDHPTIASGSPMVPLSPPVRPRSAQPAATLEERDGTTGQSSGSAKNVKAQPLRFPGGSPIVTVSLELKDTKVVDPRKRFTVDLLTEKIKPVAPGIRTRALPIKISNPGEPERYTLSINVPARILKDNETYYFEISSPTAPNGRSTTPFIVSRTKN